MMYVKETPNGNFLEFSMLTLVPYEKNLIDKDLLSKDELNYLNSYYKLIENKIMTHLSEQGKQWLQTQLQLVL
jgi:Xaa-Pro aminopeptidase